jgi:hypothetical protein
MITTLKAEKCIHICVFGSYMYYAYYFPCDLFKDVFSVPRLYLLTVCPRGPWYPQCSVDVVHVRCATRKHFFKHAHHTYDDVLNALIKCRIPLR